MCHFLSAFLRGPLSALRVSDSQGAGRLGRGGLEERGHRWSNADDMVEIKVEVAVLGAREGKDSGEGRDESIEEERVEGFRVFRLRREVTVGGGVGFGGRVERERENVMKWWSERSVSLLVFRFLDLGVGVTDRLEGAQALENTRPNTLPAL